jgi:hypothetical protein
VVVRSQNGKLQLRLAHPDKLTKTAEQTFLLALSASANVRLSAAAAGACEAAFYRRRRQDKAFAREWRLALVQGWERLQWAAMAAAAPGSGDYDRWTREEAPALPPMGAGEAMQLLYLHQKSVKLGTGEAYRRRRRGEPWETYTARVRAMWEEGKARGAEDAALAEAAGARAARYAASGSWRLSSEAEPLPLPPLELVTGWSRASGRAPHHPGVALFGGWRIGDMNAARLKVGLSAGLGEAEKVWVRAEARRRGGRGVHEKGRSVSAPAS